MSDQPNRAERRRLDLQFKKCHRREEKKKMKATQNAHQYNAKKFCKIVPHLESKKDVSGGEKVSRIVNKRVNVGPEPAPSSSHCQIKRVYAAALGDIVTHLFQGNRLIAKTVHESIESWTTREESIPLQTLALAYSIDDFAIGIIGGVVSKALLDTDFDATKVMDEVVGLLYHTLGHLIREISGEDDSVLSKVSWDLEKLFARSLKKAINQFFNELSKHPLHTDSAETLFFDEFSDDFFDVYYENFCEEYQVINYQDGSNYADNHNSYIEELEEEINYEIDTDYEEENGCERLIEYGLDITSQIQVNSSSESEEINQASSDIEIIGVYDKLNNSNFGKTDKESATEIKDIDVEDENGLNEAADFRDSYESDTTYTISNEGVDVNKKADQIKSNGSEKSDLMDEFGDELEDIYQENDAAVVGKTSDDASLTKSERSMEPATEAAGGQVVGRDEKHDGLDDATNSKDEEDDGEVQVDIIHKEVESNQCPENENGGVENYAQMVNSLNCMGISTREFKSTDQIEEQLEMTQVYRLY